MHKKLEPILIASALLFAAGFALWNFWPGGETSSHQAENAPSPPPSAQVEEGGVNRRQEAAVLTNMMKIGAAEVSHFRLKRRYGSLEDLVRDRLLSPKFSDGAIIEGYQYSVGANAEHFGAFADPIPGPNRHYFIDESLDMRYDDNGRASSSSAFLSYSKNQPQPAGNEIAPVPPAP
jgi:hypothetical protein